ncbi:MAG TPA: pyridoxal-phosphate dependent enzyme, partial [Chloroflexota bacterium]|nr:pyridoxal-phosphate dependent enzyme [Chloroflexota bacterium]
GKGLQELKKLGWLEETNTRLIGAQAEGCAPVVRAFEAGETEVAPVVPRTIAKSLAIGAPADGFYALQAIRDSGGTAAAATDEEIVAGIDLLATTEGIFTETAGGTVIAAAKKLSERGELRADERVVLAITGCGLKTLDAIAGIRFPRMHLSRANLGEFDAAMASAGVPDEVPA